jgi:hypothetical protein
MDWEDWLKRAAAPPSDNEDDKRQRTENEIKAALADYEPLKGRPYRVYAKGSYANNTNVRLNYDVDIAVEYHGYFYSDLVFDLKNTSKADIGLSKSDDPYARDEFKSDIRAALVKAYGSSAVKDGKIAYRVRESKTTLPADVVPCWEYRRYDKFVNGEALFHEGSRVYPTDGGHKDNYPKIQRANGIAKNNRTGYRYKRMVRALKKLQTRLVISGDLEGELPSYLVECLVYNVPDRLFNNTSYMDDMRGVLARIFNATLPNGDSGKWEEANALRYLFYAGSDWSADEAHALASAAWDALGFE